MRQTILGCSTREMKKQIRVEVLICVAATVLAFAENIFCLCIRTKENANPVFALIVAADALAAWLAIYKITEKIMPRKRWLRIFSKNGTSLIGIVESVSERTQRYARMDCRQIRISGHTAFLVDNGNITLQVGQEVSAQTADGILKDVVI